MVDKSRYNQAFQSKSTYSKKIIARELSTFIPYYDRIIQWLPQANDDGFLLGQIEARKKEMLDESAAFPDLSREEKERTAVLLNGVINYHDDIQHLLTRLKQSLSCTSRVILICYNPYLSWLYRLANVLGLRRGEVPTTFVTRIDLANIAHLAGYEIVRTKMIVHSPRRFLGLGNLLNHLLPALPALRWLGLAYIATLRPILPRHQPAPSLSVVIPVRNEKGNIENALKRFPDLGCRLEIIFVEGHSEDGSWEEIQRVSKEYGDQFDIKAYRQPGRGKNDAVRFGFSMAEGDLLTILDADLTVPPELLPRFYQAYVEGYADFINGSRLVYSMEGKAMRFLNRIGNIFFARALSWVLDIKISDSLCGTKLVARRDYQRIVSWRKDFGDFDPFGDFELIFPAALLSLGIIDIPIRYLNRTYGSTNISRFTHGLLLFRMTLTGLIRIKMGFRSGK